MKNTFIRFTGKYKLDWKYISHNGGWMLFGQTSMTILSLIMTAVLSNSLNQQDFGNWRFGLSVFSLLLIFTMPGLGPSLIYHTAKNTLFNLNHVLFRQIKYGTMGLVAGAVLALYLFISKPYDHAYLLILLISLFIPFIEIFNLHTFYLKGLKKFKDATIHLTAIKTLQVVSVIATLAYTKNIFVITAVFLSSLFIGRIISYTLAYKHIPKDSDGTTERIIVYGKKLTVVNALNILTLQIDKFLVWIVLGPATLASYVIASLLPIEILRFSAILPQIALPKFAQKNINYKQELLEKIKLLFFACLLFFISYILIAPFIFNTFFPKYIDVLAVSAIMATSIMTYPVHQTISQFLVAKEKIRHVLYLKIIPLFVFFIIFFIFSHMGIWSATIAFLSREIVSVILSVYLIKKDVC